MKLADNTVLVTGGGSGIGLALAKAFALKSNTVVVCGRDPKKLAAAHLENPAIDVFRCDIASEQGQQLLVEYMARKYPVLNILINNAGIQLNYSFLDAEDHTSRIEEEVSINLIAHLKLTGRLLPFLRKRPTAAIVNVTSTLALFPKKSAPVYCATKAALHNFTKALRYQLADTQIKVFEIIPPLVDTEMTKGRGKGKIAPERLATEALRAIEHDQYEIRIGKTKLLFALNRLLPSVVERVIRNG